MVVRPAPARAAAARRHACGAGRRVSAAQQRMAARCTCCPTAPSCGQVADARARVRSPRYRRSMRSSTPAGVPISATHGRSAQLAPRQQDMARLLAREGHGAVGLNRAERFAGVAHEAARHVDGNDRQSALSGGGEHRVSRRRRAARLNPEPNSASTTSSAPSSTRVVERLDGAAPARRMVHSASPRKCSTSAEREQRAPAIRRMRQRARRDEAVAAVIARPAKDGDGPSRPTPPSLRAPRRFRRCA